MQQLVILVLSLGLSLATHPPPPTYGPPPVCIVEPPETDLTCADAKSCGGRQEEPVCGYGHGAFEITQPAQQSADPSSECATITYCMNLNYYPIEFSVQFYYASNGVLPRTRYSEGGPLCQTGRMVLRPYEQKAFTSSPSTYPAQYAVVDKDAAADCGPFQGFSQICTNLNDTRDFDKILCSSYVICSPCESEYMLTGRGLLEQSTVGNPAHSSTPANGMKQWNQKGKD